MISALCNQSMIFQFHVTNLYFIFSTETEPIMTVVQTQYCIAPKRYSLPTIKSCYWRPRMIVWLQYQHTRQASIENIPELLSQCQDSDRVRASQYTGGRLVLIKAPLMSSRQYCLPKINTKNRPSCRSMEPMTPFCQSFPSMSQKIRRTLMWVDNLQLDFW